MTRSQYTDELGNLKDEVSDLRNMQSQLEILQQSADFYLHGAYITNENFGHDGGSFDKSGGRPSEAGFFSKVSDNDKSISASKKMYASRNASAHTNNGAIPNGKPPKGNFQYSKTMIKKKFLNDQQSVNSFSGRRSIANIKRATVGGSR